MEPAETTVRAVRDVGPDTVAIDLASPAGFAAEPGQFVKLTAVLDGEEESRFYTVSSPETDDAFELTVSYDADEAGGFSEYLLALDAGDAVTVTGPFGRDYYEGEARSLVLAGGPGVGPAVAIAERALRDGNEVTVVYRDDAPVHEDRLAAAASAGAEVFVLGDDDAVREAVADAYDGQQLFVYGFADFVDLAEASVTAAGGDLDGAKVESFG
ncbi:FAD-dependent oxidoreductase [Halosegnis marinus]|uniref:FAD-dependent oxidoreductase n=1 Tax=Halosegnis marinus TaxID=3034023 RepID=A0ABD5ZRG6_9EURY|nr:FAD-dependent oxidoreductase [Halosegnis sp. DT85]